MAEHNDIELRSEKVRNIIGNIPPRLIRSGITFITILVLGLIIAAWFIPYPENMKVPVTIMPLTDFATQTESSWQATAHISYTHITQMAEGMTVHVELEGYPSRIYGYVHGFVTHINKSIIKQAGQNYFTITISLSTLPPTIDDIEIQKGMNAHAFILLSNESILKHMLKCM